ncbi:MAG: helix-turn-helix transcriptional regulator [Chloroflexi bacterium]|nr:helix-turn-helix transcriptional regulator [Chloroflexota bacterium]
MRELRVGLGLSERAAARLLGTSQTQLRRMEDPRYLPSLRSLSRLAIVYGQKLRIAFEPRDKPARDRYARARPPEKADLLGSARPKRAAQGTTRSSREARLPRTRGAQVPQKKGRKSQT